MPVPVGHGRKRYGLAQNRDTNRNVDVESKQLFSVQPQPFLAELLTLNTSLRRSRLKARNAVLISDVTVYDSELASTVMT